jgi:hypothetical protein
MTTHKCLKCNYETKYTSSLKAHLNRKTPCNKNILTPPPLPHLHPQLPQLQLPPQLPPQLPQLHPQLPQLHPQLPQLQLPQLNKFNCTYCNKNFCRKDSLNRHIKKYCKNNVSIQKKKKDPNNTTESKPKKKEYNKTKEEYNETKEEYNETKKEYNETKEEYNETKEEYNETKEEYNETKEEYNETKEEYNETIEEYNETHSIINNYFLKVGEEIIPIDHNHLELIFGQNFKTKLLSELFKYGISTDIVTITKNE